MSSNNKQYIPPSHALQREGRAGYPQRRQQAKQEEHRKVENLSSASLPLDKFFVIPAVGKSLSASGLLFMEGVLGDARPVSNTTLDHRTSMKLPMSIIPATLALSLLLGAATAPAQPQRGAERLMAKTLTSNPAAEEALALALAGPDGEYAAYAEYAAIVQKFGQLQPYASILRAEERHIAALKRHFELHGLAVPENLYAGKVEASATLKAAADAGVAAEERNVAMYDQLLKQIKDQPDLVRVFTHLQAASRECHLPAFQAAAAKDGQLQAGEFVCGMGCGQGRGGPPSWAGGCGQGFGRGGCCGACPWGAAGSNAPAGQTGWRYRHGAPNQSQSQ